MDYSNWTLDELEQLREFLERQGAEAEEKDAVVREIERRGSPVSPSARESAVAVGYGDTANSQRQAARERVGVALRFVAVLIDGGVFFLLGFLLALLSGGTYTSSTAGTHTAGFHVGSRSFVILALIGFVYYVSSEVLFGATLGKLALGLRVVDEEGGPSLGRPRSSATSSGSSTGSSSTSSARSPSGRRLPGSASATVPPTPTSCARRSSDRVSRSDTKNDRPRVIPEDWPSRRALTRCSVRYTV